MSFRTNYELDVCVVKPADFKLGRKEVQLYLAALPQKLKIVAYDTGAQDNCVKPYPEEDGFWLRACDVRPSDYDEPLKAWSKRWPQVVFRVETHLDEAFEDDERTTISLLENGELTDPVDTARELAKALPGGELIVELLELAWPSQ